MSARAAVSLLTSGARFALCAARSATCVKAKVTALLAGSRARGVRGPPPAAAAAASAAPRAPAAAATPRAQVAAAAPVLLAHLAAAAAHPFAPAGAAPLFHSPIGGLSFAAPIGGVPFVSPVGGAFPGAVLLQPHNAGAVYAAGAASQFMPYLHALPPLTSVPRVMPPPVGPLTAAAEAAGVFDLSGGAFRQQQQQQQQQHQIQTQGLSAAAIAPPPHVPGLAYGAAAGVTASLPGMLPPPPPHAGPLVHGRESSRQYGAPPVHSAIRGRV